LAQVRRPLLLRTAFPDIEIAVPPPVLKELRRGESQGLPAVDWSWLAQIELSPSEQARSEVLVRKIGPGESACIAAAEARDGFVLTDDLEARRLSLASGLTVTGTLGVLDRLIRKGDLSLEEGDRLLAEMIRRGYRSPVSSLRSLYAR
jgi:predicted nucleic acid-binding protein